MKKSTVVYPFPKVIPILVGAITVNDIKNSSHATEFNLDKNTSEGFKFPASNLFRIPCSEKTPREAGGTSGAKFPIWLELRESMHNWVGTAHSLLEEDHIQENRMKERAKVALFGLAPQTPGIERKDQH